MDISDIQMMFTTLDDKHGLMHHIEMETYQVAEVNSCRFYISKEGSDEVATCNKKCDKISITMLHYALNFVARRSAKINFRKMNLMTLSSPASSSNYYTCKSGCFSREYIKLLPQFCFVD